jgi:hypothetical protein
VPRRLPGKSPKRMATAASRTPSSGSPLPTVSGVRPALRPALRWLQAFGSFSPCRARRSLWLSTHRRSVDLQGLCFLCGACNELRQTGGASYPAGWRCRADGPHRSVQRPTLRRRNTEWLHHYFNRMKTPSRGARCHLWMDTNPDFLLFGNGQAGFYFLRLCARP